MAGYIPLPDKSTWWGMITRIMPFKSADRQAYKMFITLENGREYQKATLNDLWRPGDLLKVKVFHEVANGIGRENLVLKWMGKITDDEFQSKYRT